MRLLTHLAIVAVCTLSGHALYAQQAAQTSSALSRLPDSTVQRLHQSLVFSDSPLRAALRNKLEELRGEVDVETEERGAKELRGADQASVRQASAHRVEIKQMREQQLQELRSLEAQVGQISGAEHAAVVHRLIEQVQDRFDRLDGAMGRLEQAKTAADLKHARHGLSTLLESLREPPPAVSTTPVPMKSMRRGSQQAPGLSGPSRKLPQYALQMLQSQNYAAAQMGHHGIGYGEDQAQKISLAGYGNQGFGFVKASTTLPPVAPDAATDCSSTAADLADDGVEVQLTPEIKALAQSLQYSPVRILQWMLKEIEFEPYWGSLKGAVGVMQTHRGNATDQSSLLIALLRASNVPARFVLGSVNLIDVQPSDNANGKAQRWLGTQSYSASMHYLDAGGVANQAVQLTSGTPQGLYFNHVWVQACVPFASYRGNLADGGGYRWLPMDPSIKDHDYQAGMSVNVPLDSTFYTPYLAKRTDQLPPDYLGDQAETAARVIKSDASRLDIPYVGPLRGLRVDVLPSNIPGAVQQFVNWAGSSSPETAAIPAAFRHTFTLTVQNASGTTLATTTLSFPQNVGSRVTLSYQPSASSQSLWNSWGGALSALPAGTVSVYPQIKVDGVVVASGSNAPLLTLGTAHNLIMKIDQADHKSGACVADSGKPTDPVDSDVSCFNKTVYTNLQAGSYFALGVNAQQNSDSVLESLAKTLTTGVNANATAPTPANGAAYEATVGQLLQLVLQTYIQESVQADTQIAGMQGFRNANGYDLGLTGAQLQTTYVFDLPLTIKPAGVFVDFKGALYNFTKLNSTAPTIANSGETDAAFQSRRKAALLAESTGLGKLSTYASSALEHHVWQEALRTDAVSTIRGLQYAQETGNTLVTFTSANIAQYDTLMQVSGATSMASYKAAIQAEVAAGATVIVPKAQIAYTDPVDTTKAWRGAVYMSENATTGNYSAVINGSLSGGFPLINSAPFTNLYTLPLDPPSFQSQINWGSTAILSILTPGTQGSNSFATFVGDPVNMLTGNFTRHESDFNIKGRGGFPIVLERWYNSGSPADGPLGFGWTHSLNHIVKLYGVENGKAKISWVNGSGGEQYFSTTSYTVSGSTADITHGVTLTNPAGVEVQFTRISGGANDGQFQIRERDGTVYLFASATGPSGTPSATSAVSARLLSITDRNANVLKLNYSGTQLSSVTDSLGRTVLSFTWTGTHITQISDVSGRKVVYAYTDGNNNLTQVTDALSQIHGYSYYTSTDGAKMDHHLKRYTLPRGNGMEFAYYSGGQVFRHTAFDTQGNLVNSAATTFHYNPFSRESWSVNERGYEHHTTFDSYGNPLRIVEENGAVHTYTYDSANPYNRLTEVDSLGRVTKYTYTTGAPKNLTETKTLPSGSVLEYRDYNSFAQPQRTKDARGNWTWQKFDANGNLTDSIRVASGVTPVAGTQPSAANIVAWTKTAYDSVGNVTTTTTVKDFSAVTGPSITNNWDTNKFNILSVTRAGNRNGSTVSETSPTFTYDTLGRQKTGIDSRWYPSSRTFDALDRVVSSTDSLGKTHNFSFDANGNATGSELIDGGDRQDASSARFDALDRVADTLDYAGNRSFFGYDAAGNRISQTSPDNFTLTFDYDAANHPISAYDAAGNRIFTQLDSQSRPITVTDPNSNAVSYQYWGASGGNFTFDGRLKRVTQPAIPGQTAGRAVEYDYDAGGNVIHTRVIAADGSSTRQSYSFYDELGRVTRTVGVPDNSGNRLQVCSKYDNLSHLIEVWAGPTTDTSLASCNFSSDPSLIKQAAYTWDDFGSQLTRTDALGHTWNLAYDYYGNLSSSQSPEQIKVSSATKSSFVYESSLNGLIKTRTVPGTGSAGQTASYTHNALGQVTHAETRDGSGTLLVSYDYAYDAAHRLSVITDSRGGKSLGYAWTPGGRLSKLTLSDSGSLTHQWDFKYDPVGRLSAIIAPNSQTVNFSMDAAGRLRERSFGNGLTSQYNWLPEGSLNSVYHKVQAGSSSTQVGNAQTGNVAWHSYTYDNWGNRQIAYDNLGGVTYTKTFGYDTLDRLSSVATGNAAELEGYTFDIFGARTGKTLGSPVAQSWVYTPDNAHQLTQVQLTVGSTTSTSALLRYDDNGNLKKLCEAGAGSVSGTTSDCTATGTGSQTTALSWDGLNQLVALAKAGTTALNEAYAYDDAGSRIKKTSGSAITHYLYNGDAIVGEWNGTTLTGSPTAVYAHGTGIDDLLLRLTGSSGTPDATAMAYAQDGVGSVSTAISLSGSAANQMLVSGNALLAAGSYNASLYPPPQLADGVTAASNGTGWVGVVANGALIQLGLAGATTLEHVELYGVSGYLPSTYVVEIQNADSSWSQVAHGTSADFAFYDGSSVRAIKSFAAISTKAVRVRFTGADNANGLVWLTELQIWSSAATTVTQRFDAWGNVVSSSGTIPTYGYTGREADASGLNYNRARYYHPGLGQFISRDPSGLSAGINPYAYADGNPVSFNDPSGLLATNAANTINSYAGQAQNWLSNAGTQVGLFMSGFNSNTAFSSPFSDPYANTLTPAYQAGARISDDIRFAVGMVAAITGQNGNGVPGVPGAAGVIPSLISRTEGAAGDLANVAKEITLSRSLQGEAATHAEDAIRAGMPDVLTIDRSGAAANRQAATGALDKVPGKQLDEYPPAMFKEGGAGASVRPISPRDNMSGGACIGNACRGLPDGTKVRIKIGG